MPYNSKYFKIIYIIYLLLSFKLILESFFLYLYNFLNQVKRFSILSHAWKKVHYQLFLLSLKRAWPDNPKNISQKKLR